MQLTYSFSPPFTAIDAIEKKVYLHRFKYAKSTNKKISTMQFFINI
jgi:hypothetical protein